MINTIMGGEPERGAPCAFISFSNSKYANKEIRVVRVSDSKTIFYTYADANGNSYLPVFKKGNYKVFDTDKDLFPGLEYRINTNGKVYADSDRYSNKEEKEAIKAKAFSNITLDDWDTVNNLLYVANEPLDPVTETKWKAGDKVTIPITNHTVEDEYKNAELVLLKTGDSYDISITGEKAKLVLGTAKPWSTTTSIGDGNGTTKPAYLLNSMDIRFYRNLKIVVNRKIVRVYGYSYNSDYSYIIYDLETKKQLSSSGGYDIRNEIISVDEKSPLFLPSILDISSHSFKSTKEFYVVFDYAGGHASRSGQYGSYATEIINLPDKLSIDNSVNKGFCNYYLLPTTDTEAIEIMNEINVSSYAKRGAWGQNSKAIVAYEEEKEQMNLPFELVFGNGGGQLCDKGSTSPVVYYYISKNSTTEKYNIYSYSGTIPSSLDYVNLMVM